MRAVYIVAICVLPAVAQGQRVPSDIRDTVSVESALQLVRSGTSSGAIAYLTQEGATRGPERLALLTDSLVAIAIRSEKSGQESERRAARAAVAALATSGLPEHVASRRGFLLERGHDVHPTVFPGALGALIEIFDGTGDVGLRGATLNAIAQMGRGRATAFLVDVASTPDPPDRASAAEAVRLLAGPEVPGGLEALRGLFRTGGVTEPSAAELLRAVAEERGWSSGRG